MSFYEFCYQEIFAPFLYVWLIIRMSFFFSLLFHMHALFST
jgi:hypothetical protein